MSNKDFIQAGIFPKEISRKISKAQEVLHSSDYDNFFIISVDEAKKQLENSNEIVCLIKNYLSNYEN